MFIEYGIFLSIVVAVIMILDRQPALTVVRSMLKIAGGLAMLIMLAQYTAVQLGEVLQELSLHGHNRFQMVELGGSVCIALGMSSLIGIFIIPLCWFVNFLMYRLKLTDCINIDVYNLHQNASIGVIVWAFSDSLFNGFFSAVLLHVWTLIMADFGAEKNQEYFEVRGHVAISHPIANSFLIFACPLNWLFDHTPVINRVFIKAEQVKKHMGIFSEGLLAGFLEGLVIGLAAYGFHSIQVIELGILMGCMHILLPKAGSVYADGLHQLTKIVKRHFPKDTDARTVLVGLDAALAVGDPNVEATALLLIPTMFILAFILPGNRVLPMLDLVNLCFYISCMVPVFRGNIFRAYTGSALLFAGGLYISSWMSDASTQAFAKTSIIAGSGIRIVDLDPMASPFMAVSAAISKTGWAGYVVCMILLLLLAKLLYRNRERMRKSKKGEAAS